MTRYAVCHVRRGNRLVWCVYPEALAHGAVVCTLTPYTLLQQLADAGEECLWPSNHPNARVSWHLANALAATAPPRTS